MNAPTPASPVRACAWCQGPIAPDARRDAMTCSKSCRQARHRFVRAVLPPGGAGVASRRDPRDGSTVEDLAQLATGPRRLAYADPPYPGLSGYYRDHPDYAGEVDHAALLRRLSTYDGWALSTSARALPEVLALTVALGVPARVAAWHRGHRPNSSAHGPLNAWEPVVYWPAPVAPRSRRDTSPEVLHDTSRAADNDTLGDLSHLAAATRRVTPAQHDTSRLEDDASRLQEDASRHTMVTRDVRTDSLVFHARPRLTDPARVIGAKPAVFAAWMFRLIGAHPGDELHDLFPGSGGIARAWHIYTGHDDRRQLAPVAQLDTTRRTSTHDTTTTGRPA